MDEMIISVGDLLAVALRKGKKVVLIALTFAVLLGSYKGFNIWKAVNSEGYQNIDHLSYEQEVLKLEQSIERAKKGIEDQQDYISNSFYMGIDPHDKYVAEVHISISDVDETQLNMTFGQDVTPRDYLLGQIVAMYQIVWSTVDLPSELGLPKYAEVMDKYVRELVSISVPDKSVVTVHAIGENAAEALELAEASADILLTRHKEIEENSYQHTAAVFNVMEQNQIDEEMASYQMAQYDIVTMYNDTILESEKALRKVERPDSYMVMIAKMAIIGGIAGGVLACAWYCLQSLMQERLQSCAQAERVLGVPFVGALMCKKDFLGKLAAVFSADRTWKTEEEALGYISEMVKIRKKGEKLLLISSLKDSACEKIVQKLVSALKADGLQVSYAYDFAHNPQALAEMNACDFAVLVEKLDETKLSESVKIRRFAEECEKPIAGFVIVDQ